ncbi:hypothetical protein F5Y10DRAFT_261992 [Nemania abortiva]|nr:hypothetical protein F5Y10DRAFT_261992 [Nemania abortiva]
MPSFYEQRMLRLFEQYELPDNARTLFQALEEFKTSRLDEASLGRLIRLSPSNRSALVNTMVKCANLMKEKPKEAKHCLSIITDCGEMLEIANKPPQELGFPGFMRLPPEIRNHIYDICANTYPTAPAIIPYPKKATCSCAPHEPPVREKFQKIDLALALTSKRTSTEFLTRFFHERFFHFPCTCEMNYHLTNNEMLRNTTIEIMFHWCGPKSDVAIRQLQEMKQLKMLSVVVSRSTTRHLTRREASIRNYFSAKRSNWLPDALGWDELICLRDLNDIRVEHINKRKGDRRTDDDRQSLENMLNAYCVRVPHANNNH